MDEHIHIVHYGWLLNGKYVNSDIAQYTSIHVREECEE